MEGIFAGQMFTAPPQDIFVLPNNLVTLYSVLMLPNDFVSKAQEAVLRTEVSAARLKVDMP